MKNIFTRFVSVLFVLTITLSSAFAVPAYRGWQERTLADGTPVTVRLVGDEFFSFWETQDGMIAIEQADGTFVVSDQQRPTNQQISVRRQASKMYQSKPRKAIGTRTFAPKGLVILVQFQDVSFKTANNAIAFNNMLNQEGYSYGGATGSAVDYFKAQSNGQYVPSFDVFGPVTLPNNLMYYGEQDLGDDGKYGTSDDGEHDLYIADFVIDAVAAAEAAGCDFSQYDSDNDGYVDIVYLFYAGKGQAAGGTSETIWPHNWGLLSALYYKQTHGTSGYYYTSNSNWSLPRYDGKYINDYVCSAELRSDGSRSGIGTLCHEFSHVLGMPDYYDTEYGTNDDNGVTPGQWSIMDQGSYNNNEMTPPNYSLYDKYYMGWITSPKFLAKDAKANVTMTTAYDDGYQITGGASVVSYTNTNTVYYIENRQKTGWDAGLPGSGMIVWQVKYNSTAWSNNKPNNTAGNPRYTIVPADGKTKDYGDASDAFPTSKVNSYTPFTGCELTSITKSGSNITFKYNGGVTGHNVVVSGTGCTIEPSATIVANGTTLTATITPTDDTYDFTSITVKLGTSNLAYTLSSDKKTLTINGSNITGADSNDITITVVWTKNRYKYEMLGENCTMPDDGTVNINAALNLTITPDAGYTLADAECWDVTMGNTQLAYGTGFTYNSSNNTFSIASVTGDVQIVAYGLHPVTWRADGNVHATNVVVDGKITLPDAPGDCESGKKFVGWCTSSNYEHATTAPTFAKTGDSYSVATYYAVYATASGSGAVNKSYTFSITPADFNTTSYAANDNEKTSTATASDASTLDVKWTSSNVMKNGDNMQWKKSSGYIYNSTDLGTISSVTITSSAGSFTTYYGDAEQPSSSTTVGGGYFQIQVGSATGTVSNIAVAFVKSVGGAASYSDYSTACGTPCSNTPSMSFANATVSKTTADASFTQAVTISGKGSGQTVAYSSSNEAVATVNASTGAVTIQGVGSTTITASVAANGTYCSASASYTLTVTAAPINVTLYYNNTSATLNNQTNPYTLPTGSPYNTAMCDGDWTFDGWYGSTYDKSTTKPTYITELTATGSAYAVYKTTETTGGGGSADITLDPGADTSFPKDGISLSVSSGSLTQGTDYRVYKGGTLTITSSVGDITNIALTYQSESYDGGGWATSYQPNAATWTSPAATTGNSGEQARITQIVVTVGSGSSTTTYYATTPECTVPVVCELTGITLNTSGVTTAFVTGATFSAEGLVVTANYSNCESKDVTPTSVSSPDMSSAGQKTITVTYSEDETTVTATYTIIVSEQYTVTWMACGSVFKTEQYTAGAALVLPSPAPGNNTAGMSFAGWTTEEHYTGATAPMFISAGGAVNADATYYAIYH